MSSIKEFKRTVTTDQDLDQLQKRLQEFFQPIVNCALLDGILLTAQEIGTANTRIEHKLRRKPQGYIVVRQNANAVIWESSEALDTAFITLRASAAVKVDLWVF